jgi:F-type H+-transporting ATPase subunit gamma
MNTLKNLSDVKIVWAVGERIQSRLAETDLSPVENFILPN